MIEAMIAGVRNPAKLAELADRRIKASPKELYDALHGRLTDHHRFLLRLPVGLPGMVRPRSWRSAWTPSFASATDMTDVSDEPRQGNK